MKTRLLILIAVILTAVSTFAVAGGLFTAPWGGTPSHLQQAVQGNGADILPVIIQPTTKKQEQPLVISKDLNILKGKGFFYVENGVLYKEAITFSGTLATSSQIVAMGLIQFVDQGEDAVLFRNDLVVGSHSSENELWLLDKITGVTKKVFDNVVSGGGSSFSAQGNLLVVVTNDMEILVLPQDGGAPIAKIGIHGVSPVFSPDGKKIAYIKLKDEKINLGDEDMFQGIAIYDIATGEDNIIFKAGTEGKEYRVIGWSNDGKRIYFPSSNDAVWSVVFDGTGSRQETNKGVESPFVPTYLNQLLFTDDGTMAFGEADGIWAFRLGKNGEFLSSKKVVKGVEGHISTFGWLEKGKNLAFRPYGAVVSPATGETLPKSFTAVYPASSLK